MKRKTARTILAATLAFALTAQGPAWAFETNDQGHGGITRDALHGVSITLNGETLRFTDRAILEIHDANFAVDWHQFAADFHFDDEKLPAGSQRINALKTQVISSALGGNGAKARKALGGALHTIQDFFAHSNQVDAALSIPDFGTDVLTALPATTATCLTDGATLIPNVGLTSGYFKFVNGLCAPKNKCNHGDHGFCLQGINKDAPAHPLHGAAYGNATSASIRFVNSILNDPRMTADPRAIKRLMDIRPALAAAIDDTGSMGPVIGSVRDAATLMVRSLQGTANEPDTYLLERFGDPDVGSATVFTDGGSFLSAVSAISPAGGDD